MPKSALPRIAILGAGPIGLEAALYARKLEYSVDVYEAGRIGEYVQRWGHVRLFSPFSMNVTSLGLKALRQSDPHHDFPGPNECTTGRVHVARYLKPLSECELLQGCIHIETEVVQVGRKGLLKEEAIGDSARAKQAFRLLLRHDKKGERIAEADIVLDCTGNYGQHRWLGDGGIPAIGERTAERNVCYTLEDFCGQTREEYAGKTILVIGAGYSAATTVCQLAELAEKSPDTWIIWLARGRSSQPVHRYADDPLKERDRLAARANTLATRADGNVEFHPRTAIDAIESRDNGIKVTANCGGERRTWEVDRVVANVGYTPNNNLYRELQIHECYASLGPMKLAASLLGQSSGDCLKQTSMGADTLRNPEPGFFILGAKSYGRNSNFLMRVGFEQIREVFCLITGKNDLNLYRSN